MMRTAQARLVGLVAAILISAYATPALLAAPSGTAGVSAQGSTPVIDSAELRLWPEYDDPGVLVVFSGQFAEDATFPLQAAFPIPVGARNIQATYQDASGSLINRPYEVKDGKLLYELPSAGFHMEYYLDRAPSGDERDIKYAFEAPYAINALTVSFQEPARASGFTLSPASDAPQKGTDGLTYYGFNRRNLAAGEKVEIEARYTKADTGLSAPQLAVAPASPAAQGAAAASGTTTAAAGAAGANWLPWLLIGLGIVLLAAVLAYWLLSQRREPAPAPVASSKPRAQQAGAPVPPRRTSVAAQSTGDAVSFCTNCGHPLRPDDRFCSQCGAPRRS